MHHGRLGTPPPQIVSVIGKRKIPAASKNAPSQPTKKPNGRPGVFFIKRYSRSNGASNSRTYTLAPRGNRAIAREDVPHTQQAFRSRAISTTVPRSFFDGVARVVRMCSSRLGRPKNNFDTRYRTRSSGVFNSKRRCRVRERFASIL